MGWRVFPTGAQVLAVHAALLHTGQILYFGGDEHDAGQNDRDQIDHTRLFDCASLTVSVVGSPTSDLFCSGHAFLMDGRLLVAGGTEDFPTDQGPHAPHFPGLRDASIFEPWSRRWIPVASMNPEPGRTTGGGRCRGIPRRTTHGIPTTRRKPSLPLHGRQELGASSAAQIPPTMSPTIHGSTCSQLAMCCVPHRSGGVHSG